MEINHCFEIGEKGWRRNNNYPDEPNKWIPIIFNETYLALADEFPEDFRTFEGKEWVKNSLQCDICNHVWWGLYLRGTERLECPNCRQMADYFIL